MEIKIVIPGQPIQQERPRSRIVQAKGKAPFVSVYDSKRSKDNKAFIASCAVQVKPDVPLDCDLEVEVIFYRELLKSFSKKKTEQALAGQLRPNTKPDIDNYVKAVFDGINGIIWKDDARVVDLKTSKYYSDKPRTEVIVRTIESQQEKLF
ncbi:RusA family crossover junction endodeoxyribonuclease [Vagococcus hydrophili]|uniref:RusA family crossover junction endodeoxyribonuclease n=1 Tax=Vagococcus hydrophili TaxID=2714947 RepID=A0A6G8APQ1_9ENTE|nr:RusA family crossover junction endodeoxyribonuclease [Vagococcus hydrophili]QIL47054.1 RusA family crossover junction endodeoxyribonuclease [Vagococcus hydrophili]